jgi:hypothetical protein
MRGFWSGRESGKLPCGPGPCAHRTQISARSLAHPSSAAPQNPCRRQDRNDKLRELDAMLPNAHKTSKPAKTAGASRACGSSGRSLQNVLSDVIVFIKNEGLLKGESGTRRTQGESEEPPAPGAVSGAVDVGGSEDDAPAVADRTVLSGDDVRAGFLSSHTLFVAELRLSDFATLALSPGAIDFLALSPWAERWERQEREDSGKPRGAERGDGHQGADVSAGGVGTDAAGRRQAKYYHLSCITHHEDTAKLLDLAHRAHQLSLHGAHGGSSSASRDYRHKL